MLWPRSQTGRGRWTTSVAALLLAYSSHAQNLPAPAVAFGGQGELAVQGFYLGGHSQPLLDTTGTALQFQALLPSLGLLSGSLEAYGAQNRFQLGQNYLELRGVPWLGEHWTFTAGDFQAPAILVDFPFTNVFTPEIDARGFKLEAAHRETRYEYFFGQETLTAGTRVAYRLPTPQWVTGASVIRKLAHNFQVAARAMQFSTSAQGMLANPYLYPAGRAIGLARIMALQASYAPVKRLKLYTEASQPLDAPGRKITSAFAGASWESGPLAMRVNYVSQGILYFPLAGYYAGDRRGPFAEVRYHPFKRLELYGSASHYRNNLESNPALAFLSSGSQSAGASLLIPGGFSASASYSKVRFNQTGGGQDPTASDNRQWNGTVTKSIARQTLHADFRQIDISTQPNGQRQRSWEAGDSFQIKHFSAGGSVRYQQLRGSQTLNTLFFRGQAQVNVGRVSAYANVEVGNDQANQTVFATEAYQTSVAGVAVHISKDWSMQAEAFRNRLNLAVNPESTFLLGNDGALAGLSPAAIGLAGSSQWSLYFRVSRQFRVGAGMPSSNTEQVLAKAAPLVGEVEGAVRIRALSAVTNAAGIAISLDGNRTAVTGPNGYYHFGDVPEGPHEVAVDLAQLPADYDPGDVQKVKIVTQARKSLRADFEVLPLVSLSGKVTGPEGADLSDIIIRMSPGGRYTSTRKDGSFAFHNVHEGDFELALDSSSLPENGELKSEGAVPAVVRLNAAIPPIEFRIAIHSAAAKPIKKVLDKK